MFWNVFYDTCLKKGTKPNPVAKELKIASSTVTSWKSGSIPNGETLIKLADYLDVSVDYLLGRTEEPKKINYGVENHGDNNGAINNQVNAPESKLDGLSKEMLDEFEKLTFNNKAKVMSLIAELSENQN